MLGAVRALNRLGCAIETLRAALNALAAAAPEWLRLHADPAWADRYAKRADDLHVPKGEAARRAFAEQVGRDGHALLASVMEPEVLSWLREMSAVEVLRRVWVQNFLVNGNGGLPVGTSALAVRWRTEAEGFPPSALMVASPYDADVHYAK